MRESAPRTWLPWTRLIQAQAEAGLADWLSGLREELRHQPNNPQPVRRVLIQGAR